TDLSGSFNTPLLYINGTGELNINGIVNIGNENLGTQFSDVYVDGSGTIRVNGSNAALNCTSAGTDSRNVVDGVINLTSGGNFYVTNGGSLN
ncbi:hypothetical protein, partial [Bartonella sp. TT110JLCBS]|uniref:hypothetical protein n=1 Tax=Bartonella sp. TT110JLCBS TaxID=3243578 RepID=UPI0035CF63A3